MNGKKFYSGMISIYILTIALMIGFAYWATTAITVLSENSPVDHRKVIVIDAGHGGIDGGATSCNGILESQTNLQIALRLRDVCNLLGLKTIMIRTEDISVYTSGNTIAAKKVSDLKERVRIANKYSGSTLISIHQNYFTDSKYRGAQVFYSPNENSRQLANIMQEALVHNLNPDSTRTSKAANGIYLMQNIHGTGLLIECGFISNHEENILLQDKSYQQKLSIVIASTLSLHLNA